jgi:hypothetical protein
MTKKDSSKNASRPWIIVAIVISSLLLIGIIAYMLTIQYPYSINQLPRVEVLPKPLQVPQPSTISAEIPALASLVEAPSVALEQSVKTVSEIVAPLTQVLETPQQAPVITPTNGLNTNLSSSMSKLEEMIKSLRNN